MLLLLAGGLQAAGRLDPTLPGYQPEVKVHGGLNSVGDDALEPLMNAWLDAFRKYQPEVIRGERWSHPGGAAAFSALMFETTDVAPLGREPWPAELAPYAHQFKGDMMKEPLLVRVAIGSFTPPGQSGALAVYVNAANPIAQLSLTQLDAIFGAQRRRGGTAAITTWGQLGLAGEWADRPILPLAPPDYATPALVFQHRVLRDGLWTPAIETTPAAALLQKVAATPGAIAFAGFMNAPGTKTLALAETEGGPFVTGSAETVANHTYPITRDLYLAVNQRPGAPLPQKTKEFLTYVLSREGQQIVANYPHFFALKASDAAQERAKLAGYLAPVDPAIPAYQATAKVSGPIANVGSDGMESLMEKWMSAFCRLHPGVHRGARWSHQGTLNGYQALLAGEADIAAMGRELWPGERVIYKAVRGANAEPLEIRVARGGFNTPQRTTAQAILVHPSNPVAGLTLAQIDAIFGRDRRRGAPEPIVTWGQLGLSGEWANRPIAIHIPYRAAPNSMSMQMLVLKDGAWNAAAQEGSIAEVAASIAKDPGAIGFGGLEEGPGLKAVPVAAQAGEPFITPNAADAASGRYPLTRYMYIRLNREPGKALAPQVREFLRFILSREGQEFIPTSAYYPLRADEVAAELAKLAP